MAATANPRARLEHILFHIRGVADTVSGIDFDTYTSVYHMERTVERAVQIISEAARAAIRFDRALPGNRMGEDCRHRQRPAP